VAVTLWESEEAMRATEGPSYWLRAFGAEAAGGEITGLDRYEVVSSEAWRAQPSPQALARGLGASLIIHPTA
jgi:hypothetical protein